MMWTILLCIGLTGLLVMGIWLVATGQGGRFRLMIGIGSLLLFVLFSGSALTTYLSPNDNITVKERQLAIVKSNIDNDLDVKFVNVFNCIIPLLKEELQMKDGTKIYLNKSELHGIVESDVCDTLFAYSLVRKAPLYQDSVRILFLTKHPVRSYDYQLFLRNLNASTQIE